MSVKPRREKHCTLRRRVNIAPPLFSSSSPPSKPDHSSESSAEEWQYVDDPAVLVSESGSKPALEDGGPLCAAFIAVAFLLCIALVVTPQHASAATASEELRSTRLSLAALSTAFLIYCAVYIRDNYFQRPNPVVWRISHGLGLLYFLLLCFLTTKDIQEARRTMTIFDSSLGPVPVENFREYASDCRLYAPDDKENPYRNIYETVFDIFTLAHAVGWVAKGIIIRDYPLLWIWSLGWEVMEISFQFLLPNFKECWWDHWVFDMLACNFPGMVIGMWVCARLDFANYGWTSKSHSSSVLSQFSPFSWTLYSWDALNSPTRLFQVMLLLGVMLIAELNAFFLKFLLYIPPSSMLNAIRLLLFAAWSLPAVYEYYEYIQPGGNQPIGSNLWLMGVIVITELVLVVKFSLEDLSQYSAANVLGEELAAKFIRPQVPRPSTVLTAWILSAMMFVTWCVLFFGSKQKTAELRSGDKGSYERRTGGGYSRFLNLILWGSSVPLLYLIAADFKDTFH